MPGMLDPSIDQQDRDDMARLSAGHEAALNSLMNRHAERLFHYLLRQLANESDAADLAQETFARVFQHRARFDPRQKFSTWLYAIATNLLRDRFRWQKRHPQVSLDAEPDEGSPLRDHLAQPSESPAERLDQEERAEAVRAAIASLPEELRTPLLLSEYEDLSHAEVGTILRCTAKAVENRLYRARAHLRKHLQKVLQPG
jgi:RNA polymerase sigma-70 factor, ECF subfamily